MCTSCPVLTTWREVDEVAERIRALGEPAPGNYKAFSELTSIEEEEGVPSAEDMIRQLVGGQEAVTRTARSIFPAVEKANDEPTADLLTQRMQVHEKNRSEEHTSELQSLMRISYAVY